MVSNITFWYDSNIARMGPHFANHPPKRSIRFSRNSDRSRRFTCAHLNSKKGNIYHGKPGFSKMGIWQHFFGSPQKRAVPVGLNKDTILFVFGNKRDP